MRRLLLAAAVLAVGLGAGALHLGTAQAVKKRAVQVAQDRNEQLMDPWNAPLGAPVLGGTLHDGWRDLREVPAPVNVDGGWTDSVLITRNGRRLYYGYARYDFWEFYQSVSTPTPAGVQLIPTGPVRPGMTGNAFKIFQADLRPEGWRQSFHPINGDPGLSEAAAAVNTAENLLVFSRFPTGLSRAIYYSSKTAAGWSEPAEVPGINSPCEDDNGFVIGDLQRGTTFYFESKRADPAAGACGDQRRLFRAYFPPGAAHTGVSLVPGLAGGDDSQPFVSPDQEQIYWTSIRNGQYGVFTADLQPTGDYGNIRPVLTGTTSVPYAGRLVLMGEANVARVPQGELMYLMCGISESESGGYPADVRLAVCVARRP